MFTFFAFAWLHVRAFLREHVLAITKCVCATGFEQVYEVLYQVMSRYGGKRMVLACICVYLHDIFLIHW